MERSRRPEGDRQRIRVDCAGGIRSHEEVSRAITGTLNIINETKHTTSNESTIDITQDRVYLHKSTPKVVEEDVIMIDTDVKPEVVKADGQFDESKLKTDNNYIRDLLAHALQDVKYHLTEEHVLFGTNRGSIG